MPQPRQRLRRSLLLLLLLLSAICTASLFVGTRPIPARVTLDAFLAFDPANSEHLLVRQLRLPRVMLAVVVGAALGVAGVIMQALTRNPLADPGTLGVNAGATLGVVAAIAFLGITDMQAYLWCGVIGAGFGGGLVFVLGGLRDTPDPVRMVLAGMALSVVLLALTQIITVNSDAAVFDQFRHWAVGSLQGRGFAVLWPCALLVAAGLVLAFVLARALDMAALGVDLSTTLGADPRLLWLGSALAIVLLSGAATAAAGPISFVGLTAPHIARAFAGPDHRRVMPLTLLLSAILVAGADLLGLLVGWPGEIGAGIMVALIGGPFFIFLVQRRRIAAL